MFRRFYSRVHNAPVKTRFPTKYNPIRSAYKQIIELPEGLVYNPSPAAPNPLDTPAAFVPAQDGRVHKKFDGPADVSTMPALFDPKPRTHHLTAEDAIQMQQLRDSEPETWTRKALAEKYKVTERAVGILTKPNAQRDAEMQSRLETIKSLWTVKTERARVHRLRRKAFWLRDA